MTARTPMSEDAYADLPGFLREVAQAAGWEAACDLARKLGGSVVYIPSAVGEKDTLLTRAVGRTAAAKICRLRPRENVLVPMGPWSTDADKRVKARGLLNEGVPVNEIVRRLGIHRTTVYRILAELQDARQGCLFERTD